MSHEHQRTNLKDMLRNATKAWHGVKLNEPDWSDESRSVALGGEVREEGVCFHLFLNAFWKPLVFELPKPTVTNPWRRWIDTSLDSPDDIACWEEAPIVTGDTYQVADRSVVMLYSNSES
jgi:glycogen operon protein